MKDPFFIHSDRYAMYKPSNPDLYPPNNTQMMAATVHGCPLLRRGERVRGCESDFLLLHPRTLSLLNPRTALIA
jgi:hypothetical protein